MVTSRNQIPRVKLQIHLEIISLTKIEELELKLFSKHLSKKNYIITPPEQNQRIRKSVSPKSKSL